MTKKTTAIAVAIAAIVVAILTFATSNSSASPSITKTAPVVKTQVSTPYVPGCNSLCEAIKERQEFNAKSMKEKAQEIKKKMPKMQKSCKSGIDYLEGTRKPLNKKQYEICELFRDLGMIKY